MFRNTLGYGTTADNGDASIPLYCLLRAMVQTRIKPHDQQVAEAERRAEQTRVFRRNQMFGLLIVAAAIFVFWLIRTKPGWVLPAGWWRP